MGLEPLTALTPSNWSFRLSSSQVSLSKCLWSPTTTGSWSTLVHLRPTNFPLPNALAYPRLLQEPTQQAILVPQSTFRHRIHHESWRSRSKQPLSTLWEAMKPLKPTNRHRRPGSTAYLTCDLISTQLYHLNWRQRCEIRARRHIPLRSHPTRRYQPSLISLGTSDAAAQTSCHASSNSRSRCTCHSSYECRSSGTLPSEYIQDARTCTSHWGTCQMPRKEM